MKPAAMSGLKAAVNNKFFGKKKTVKKKKPAQKLAQKPTQFGA